jgi:hypothetical protein
MPEGSHRIPAARWAIGLGRCYLGLAVLAAAWSSLAVLFTGAWTAVAVPMLLAGYAAVWGVLVRALAAHRPAAWWLLTGLSALGLLGAAFGWLAGGPVSVLSLVAAIGQAVFLGLLLHPDTREWVRADEPRREVGAGTGRHPGERH